MIKEQQRTRDNMTAHWDAIRSAEQGYLIPVLRWAHASPSDSRQPPAAGARGAHKIEAGSRIRPTLQSTRRNPG